MRSTTSIASGLGRDQRGQMAIEWVLLVVAFALPMAWGFKLLLATLAEYYRMVTFLETLPLP